MAFSMLFPVFLFFSLLKFYSGQDVVNQGVLNGKSNGTSTTYNFFPSTTAPAVSLPFSSNGLSAETNGFIQTLDREQMQTFLQMMLANHGKAPSLSSFVGTAGRPDLEVNIQVHGSTGNSGSPLMQLVLFKNAAGQDIVLLSLTNSLQSFVYLYLTKCNEKNNLFFIYFYLLSNYLRYFLHSFKMQK